MVAYKDLQHFIRVLEEKDELVRIKVEVDSYLEVTEIADRISKQYGKALLFENVKDSPYPILINAMGTYERMSMALGVKELDEAGALIADLVNIGRYMKIGSLIKSIPSLFRMIGILPIKLPIKGKCQEVIEREPDLGTLPVLHCWPQDGGRFFTLPLIFTKDPKTGIQNIGMYRLQVFDKNTTGMHWHLHKDGREIYESYKKRGGKMPVSVVLGCDPAITYAATAPLPKMIDEIMFAGFLRGKPIKQVKSITNDIYVPADAEFVIEGYVDVNEPLRKEGPFGDHTGYYSLADDYPIFHVTCITHSKKPVYPATIVGKPPMEDCYMGKATERLFLPLLKMIAPEIVDIDFPLEGVFHGCVIMSIKKRYPAHGKKMMNTAWGMGQMMYTKMIIVVDGDVDVHNYKEVSKVLRENVNPASDIVLSDGPLDALDHASTRAFMGTRLGFDATRKIAKEGYKDGYKRLLHNKLSEEEIKDMIHQELTLKHQLPIIDVSLAKDGVLQDILVLSIKKEKGGEGTKVLEALWQYENLPTHYVIIVDSLVDPRDTSTVTWKLFNNIDAARDMQIHDFGSGDLRVGIDATKKWASEGHYREWPDDIEMSQEIKEKVDRRWNEYGIN